MIVLAMALMSYATSLPLSSILLKVLLCTLYHQAIPSSAACASCSISALQMWTTTATASRP